MSGLTDDEIEALLRDLGDDTVPIGDFRDRVMAQLPPRRRRVAWPFAAGIVAGVLACWWSLRSTTLLIVGWRDWMSGTLSEPSATLWGIMAGSMVLTLLWIVFEAENRCADRAPTRIGKPVVAR